MKTLSRALGEAFKPADPLRAERARAASAARKARAVAATLGVDIDPAPGGGWFVTFEPFANKADDPLDGNHFAADGHEMLAAVQAYQEAREKAVAANAEAYAIGVEGRKAKNPHPAGTATANAWDAGLAQGRSDRRDLTT